MTAKRIWLTPPEVAEQLGVERDKVVKWIRAGELSAVNCALNKNSKRARWRMKQEDVEAFLESRRNGTPRVKKTRAKVSATRDFYPDCN